MDKKPPMTRCVAYYTAVKKRLVRGRTVKLLIKTQPVVPQETHMVYRMPTAEESARMTGKSHRTYETEIRNLRTEDVERKGRGVRRMKKRKRRKRKTDNPQR